MPRSSLSSVLIASLGIGGVLLALNTQAAGNPQKSSQKTGTASQAQSETSGEVREAEDKLKRLLDELHHTLTAAAWSELAAVQTNWENFRNRDCSWERQFFQDGSVAPLVYSQCLKTHTLQRVDRLKLFLCEGYSMTGPCEASEKY